MDPDVVDVDHIAFRVTDLEEALAFYHDLLGLPIRDRERYDAGDVPFVALAAGGRHLHLVPTDDPTIDGASGDEAASISTTGDESPSDGDVPLGGDHLCLLIRSEEMDGYDQLCDLLSRIEAAGYDVDPDEPKKRYGAYGRDWAAYVRDPDGRRVELKIH
ncbi:VOC family protein [Halorubrum vacuolatum]|uniref:Catechol 2,3-dioxygenase n=1 Tax=Halorubrum vacuolatum TaxID=63740 RepID=A0A238VGP5_HALVU|nr:VOC family protein [Halorubrum vacuolatum]SNR32863.1 Catechol 2,3-dioxygenase [Halorubrum vacuolatum]